MKDTLGRENRKIADRRCNECGRIYRPKRELSKYCSQVCKWRNNGKNQGQATNHEVWWVGSKGYVLGRIWRDGKCIRVKRARWLMEQHIGRILSRNEVVHHINEIKTDDGLENLEIVEFGTHTANHHKGRIYHNTKYTITSEERQRRSNFMKEVHRRRQENDPTNKWYARPQLQRRELS